jgi:SAM-dependent methyltransferase
MSTENLYDKYSKNYMEGNDRLAIYHRYRLQTFKSLLDENFNLEATNVIDYGCGDGVISQCFGDGNLVGIDPSKEMVRLAQTKYSKNKFLVGGLEELEHVLSIRRFDLLVCLNTLPYMNEAEIGIFFSIASKYKIPLVLSHTNELLDLNSFNRYTIEHRESLLKFSKNASGLIKSFKNCLSHPNSPPPIAQTIVRFGETKINASERDTIKKFRVDPFTWPDEIADKYSLQVRCIQPIRIFALPPSVMEADDDSFAMLHSDCFDALPSTYKLILCSQFRVIFEPT